MLAFATPSELTEYATAQGAAPPATEDAALARALYRGGAVVEAETRRKLAWRRYRAMQAFTATSIVASTKIVTHASGLTFVVGDVVSGGGLPWGTQVASVTDATHFIVDQDPAADVNNAPMSVGDGCLRAWPADTVNVQADQWPVTAVDALFYNGVQSDAVPTIVDGELGVIDSGRLCYRGNYVVLEGAAGIQSGSAEYESAKLLVLRVAHILWQRSYSGEGAVQSEAFGQRSVSRQPGWPDDVQRMIDALRRVA